MQKQTNETTSTPAPLPQDYIHEIKNYLSSEGSEVSSGLMGKYFSKLYRGYLLFCPETITWYYWNNTHWKKDTGLYVEMSAKQYLKRCWATMGEFNENHRGRLSKQLKYFDSKSGIGNILYMGRTEPSVIIQSNQLNTHPQLLNCSNGTINLSSGIKTSHDPNNFITKLVPIEYKCDAKSDLWNKFLSDCTNDSQEMIEHLQRAIGSSLSGDRPDNKFFLLHGPSGTGKTTFMETIRIILDDYARMTGFSTFTAKKYRSDPSPELIDLEGSRLVDQRLSYLPAGDD